MPSNRLICLLAALILAPIASPAFHHLYRKVKFGDFTYRIAGPHRDEPHHALHHQRTHPQPPSNFFEKSDTGTYSDAFARHKMLHLAAAAYSDQPGDCLGQTDIFPNASLYRYANVSCDGYKEDVCAGYTAVSHSDQAIILAFGGTRTFLQLLIETSDTLMCPRVASPIGGLVGEYFMDIFKELWINESVGADLLSLTAQYPNYELWITGHSLGGALAAIATAEISVSAAFDSALQIRLVTLGQPRTGDLDWANALDNLSSNIHVYRVTHRRDPIPHLPPHNFENYTHHQTEAWYPGGMEVGTNYTVCEGVNESASCANKIRLLYWGPDHLYYFGRWVSAWGRYGCDGAGVSSEEYDDGSDGD